VTFKGVRKVCLALFPSAVSHSTAHRPTYSVIWGVKGKQMEGRGKKVVKEAEDVMKLVL